jgi:CHRD domain
LAWLVSAAPPDADEPKSNPLLLHIVLRAVQRAPRAGNDVAKSIAIHSQASEPVAFFETCSMALRALLLTVLLLAPAAPAWSHHFRYTANLTGPAEFPANSSSGFGHAVITIDFDENVLEIETDFEGLLGTVTEAHIHAPTASVGIGVADPATQLPTFTDFPEGVSSGSYEGEFDLALASTYNPAFIASSGGTISTAYNGLADALNNGKAYFDIHTSAFPDGEIRGFLSYVLGDYSDNGIVDAADYVLWRKTVLTTGEGLKADSNNDNVINDDDYTAWRQNFGNAGLSSTPGSGAALSASIPEPGALALVAFALLAPLGLRRRPRYWWL